jgi:hypothetical protein
MTIDPRKIMQLYDGELDPAEAERIAREIGQDGESKRMHEGFVDVGVAVRLWADAAEQRNVAQRKPPRARAVKGGIWLGLAAAAAVMALVSTKGGEPPHARARPTLAIAEPSRAVTPAVVEEDDATAEAAANPESTGAAIEMVDFGAGGGTIFVVSKGTEATPVVWLSDDEPPARQAKPL